MYLTRLIYCSQPVLDSTGKFDSNTIETILQSARVNNAKLGVTGLLCFDNHYFLQCLEGRRKHVNAIYQAILHDQRHSDVLLLSYEEIFERDFDSWAMAYIPDNLISKPINIKYSGNNEFNPSEMSAESCHRLMRELSTRLDLY